MLAKKHRRSRCLFLAERVAQGARATREHMLRFSMQLAFHEKIEDYEDVETAQEEAKAKVEMGFFAE